MTARVSWEDLNVAIMWLESNEGDGGESDACQRVAKQLQRQQDNISVRKVTRATGVSAQRARQVLTKAGAQ